MDDNVQNFAFKLKSLSYIYFEFFMKILCKTFSKKREYLCFRNTISSGGPRSFASVLPVPDQV